MPDSVIRNMKIRGDRTDKVLKLHIFFPCAKFIVGVRVEIGNTTQRYYALFETPSCFSKIICAFPSKFSNPVGEFFSAFNCRLRYASMSIEAPKNCNKA